MWWREYGIKHLQVKKMIDWLGPKRLVHFSQTKYRTISSQISQKNSFEKTYNKFTGQHFPRFYIEFMHKRVSGLQKKQIKDL